MVSRHTTQPPSSCLWLLLQAFAGFVTSDAWSPRPPVYQIVGGDGKPHKGLYPQGGPVEALSGPEGLALLQQDPNIVWIVQYYDVNCPHCWYFSAIYPAIAKAVASPTVRVASFMCTDDYNAAACSAAHVNGFPSVMVYNGLAPGSKYHVHVHVDGNIDDPKPAKAIAADLSTYSNGKIPTLHPEVFQSGSGLTGSGTGNLVMPDGPPGKDGWTNEAYGSVTSRFHDAHIGMSHLLRSGYNTSAKYQAALDVVEFVGNAFGKDEAKVFASLNSKLRAKPNLEPAEFRAILTAWEQQFESKWAFCQAPGVTCGVWQLFHGISALIAIKYFPIPVSEALPKFRSIVDEFMTCKVCKTHFIQSYDACLFGRCEILTGVDEPARAKAMLLWMWRLHNAVSNRVITEHPPQTGGAIDRRYPSFKDCPGCWNVTVVNGASAALETFQGQTNNDQPVYAVYNEHMVFNFLLFTYLGEEPKGSRLFEMPSPTHAQAASHVVIYTVSGAVACMSMLAFVARRFGRSPASEEPSMSQQELLEAPDLE